MNKTRARERIKREENENPVSRDSTAASFPRRGDSITRARQTDVLGKRNKVRGKATAEGEGTEGGKTAALGGRRS